VWNLKDKTLGVHGAAADRRQKKSETLETIAPQLLQIRFVSLCLSTIQAELSMICAMQVTGYSD
jgi:hypothetical protein